MENVAGTAAAGTAFALVIMVLVFAAIGAAIGAVARFVLPGRDDMSVGRTILYGIGGSFLGGLVGRLLGLESRLAGLLLAVAMAALLIWFFTRRRSSAG